MSNTLDLIGLRIFDVFSWYFSVRDLFAITQELFKFVFVVAAYFKLLPCFSLICLLYGIEGEVNHVVKEEEMVLVDSHVSEI